MKKYLYIAFYICSITVLLVNLNVAFLQNNFYPGKVWIIVHDAEIIPNKDRSSNNQQFSQLLSKFNIMEITQPMYFAKTPELRRLYELNTPYSEDSLFMELNRFNGNNEFFLSVEKVPIPKNTDNPGDPMWLLTQQNPNA